MTGLGLNAVENLDLEPEIWEALMNDSQGTVVVKLTVIGAMVAYEAVEDIDNTYNNLLELAASGYKLRDLVWIISSGDPKNLRRKICVTAKECLCTLNGVMETA